VGGGWAVGVVRPKTVEAAPEAPEIPLELPEDTPSETSPGMEPSEGRAWGFLG